MKRLLFATLIGFGSLVAIPQEAVAQVSVNINIGQQPLWGPVGYDYAQFYYIPELNVYYDVMNALFYYQHGRRWIHGPALPPRFAHYDLYRLHKFVINQSHPFRYNNRHMNQYRNYRTMQHQVAIRDARDHRYYANPRHPMHHQYRAPQPQHRAPVKHGPQRMQAQRAPQHRTTPQRAPQQQRVQAQRAPQQQRATPQRAPQQQQRRQFAERPAQQRVQSQRAPQQQRMQAQRAPQQHRATPQRGQGNNGPRHHEGGRR